MRWIIRNHLNDQKSSNDLLPISDSPDFDSNVIHWTDVDALIGSKSCSLKIRVIARGITRLLIRATSEREIDNSWEWNIWPPKYIEFRGKWHSKRRTLHSIDSRFVKMYQIPSSSTENRASSWRFRFIDVSERVEAMTSSIRWLIDRLGIVPRLMQIARKVLEYPTHIIFSKAG
jgi:hypothetical protein